MSVCVEMLLVHNEAFFDALVGDAYPLEIIDVASLEGSFHSDITTESMIMPFQ